MLDNDTWTLSAAAAAAATATATVTAATQTHIIPQLTPSTLNRHGEFIQSIANQRRPSWHVEEGGRRVAGSRNRQKATVSHPRPSHPRPSHPRPSHPRPSVRNSPRRPLIAEVSGERIVMAT